MTTIRTADESLLENAAREAEARRLHEFPIVDVDCHHFEMEAWAEIAQRVEHPVIRRRAVGSLGRKPGQFDLIAAPLGDQFVAGRIKRPKPPAAELDRDVAALEGRRRHGEHRLCHRDALAKGAHYEAAVRLRLDVTQLPKPFQVNALASKEWSLSSEWYRWSFTP